MPVLLRPLLPTPARLMTAALWMDTAEHHLDPGAAQARFGRLIPLEDFRRQRIAQRATSPGVQLDVA